MKRFGPWLLLLGLLAGCQPASEPADSPTTPADSPTTGSVELPPRPLRLAQLDPTVQQQFEERYALVERLIGAENASPSGLSWAYGQLGRWFMAYREMAQAKACFETAHRLDPQEYRWLYLLGQVERIDGDLRASNVALEKVFKLRPDDVPTLVWLGENALSERPEKAQRFFAKALDNDPQSVMAYLGLARTALELDDPDAAVESIERALAIQPRATRLLYTAGVAWRKKGDIDTARSYFDRVPDNELARIAIAFNDPLNQEVSDLRDSAQIDARKAGQAISRGDYSRAIPSLERSVESDPDRPDTRYNLAAALLKLGRRDAALDHLSILNSNHPEHTLGRVLSARLALGSGDLNAAQTHLRDALAADPRAAHVHLALGDFERWHGDLAQAETHYRRAQVLNPDQRSSRLGLGLTLLASGRDEAALEVLESARRVWPDAADIASLLARVLAAAPDSAVRDGARALVLARQAFDAEPTVSHAETLAMALAETGHFDDAVDLQRRVIARLDDRVQEFQQARRAAYQNHGPCREPWHRSERPLPRPLDHQSLGIDE